MEKWKDIPGFEGYYQASNKGRIRSIDRPVKQWGDAIQIKKGKILSPAISRIGYCVCALSRNNKLSSYPVHRLIALAWLGLPDKNNNEINHKDGIKTNNNIENLEWSNRTDNLRHSVRLGLMRYNYGQDHHNSKLTNLQRRIIYLERKNGSTLTNLANKYNVHFSTIARICERQKLINYDTI